MHEFNWIDLGGLVAVCWAVVKVLSPVAGALAKRLEGRVPATTASDPAVPQLQDELEQLHERVDFLERAITSRQSPAELPPTRTPV
jgi:cell division protein FtsB